MARRESKEPKEYLPPAGREALLMWVRGLLGVRGLQRRLAAQVPVSPEYLCRLLNPQHPARASPETARRIVEVLRGMAREAGWPFADRDASLLEDYLRRKLDFNRPSPPPPPRPLRPDREEWETRLEGLLRQYRRIGTVLNVPAGSPSVFHMHYLLLRRESLSLLSDLEGLLQQGHDFWWVKEGVLRALSITALAWFGQGVYGSGILLAHEACRRALQIRKEDWPSEEEARRRLASSVLRAVESYLVGLYNLGRDEEAAQGYEEGLAWMESREARLPDDLRISWALDYRLNRFHALARAGRLTLPKAYREYQELLEAIERGPVLPAEFPPEMAEPTRKRMRVYAYQGWAKAVLRRARTRSAFDRLIEEGERLLAQDLGFPLRITTYRILALAGRRSGDPEWESFAREGARLALETGLLHHIYRLRRELGPDGPRLLEKWGIARELDPEAGQ